MESFDLTKTAESNETGFSIIELMITFVISGFLFAAMTTFMVHQQKEAARLTQSMARLDFNRTMIDALARGTACTGMLATRSPSNFNPASLPSVDLTGYQFVPLNTSPGAPKIVSVEAGLEQISPMSPLLKAQSIHLKNFTCVNTPCTAASSQFFASLTVTYQPINTVALQPSEFKVVVDTIPLGGGLRQISSCSQTRVLRFTISLATLNQFHIGSPLLCSTLFGASVEQYMHLMSACSRWCTSGCASADPTISGCQAVLPGQGYTTGFTAECNPFTNETFCNCST